MSRTDKYVPKHRDLPSAAVAKKAPRRALKSTLLLSTAALAVTGAVVSGGIWKPTDVTGAVDVSPTAATTQSLARGQIAAALISTGSQVAPDPDRAALVTRSDARGAADPAKAAALTQPVGAAMSRTEDMSGEDPRTIAKALLTEFGFEQSEFACLDPLYDGESHWRVNADNPHSSAYGIPQALPGSKMSSAGADWATNPVTQIRWGLGYIQARYGTPCGAWSFKRGHGWY